MKTITTTYKTRNGEGTIIISKESLKMAKASFDGLDVVTVALVDMHGIVGVRVNLKNLHKVGFAAPNIDQQAVINLPEFNNLKDLKAEFEDADLKGKVCGDGIFRTYDTLKKLNYTEMVMAGEYTE